MEYVFVRKYNELGCFVDVFCLLTSCDMTFAVVYNEHGKKERYECVDDFSAALTDDDCEDVSTREEFMLTQLKKALENLFVSRMDREDWARRFSTGDFSDERWKATED